MTSKTDESLTLFDTTAELMSDPKVVKALSVHPKTLDRWDDKPELGFPPLLMINGRRYRRVKQLRSWILGRAVGKTAA